MIITSLENSEIKRLSKLSHKKYQDEYKEFLVEGIHLVEEGIKKNRIKKIILLEGFNYQTNIDTLIVSRQVMKKISNQETVPNIMGLCKIEEENYIGNRVLLLSDIQDPGNLGTIIRSSVAFNIDTVILSLNTVNLYNPKVIRATEGNIFHINIIRRNLKDVIIDLKSKDYDIVTTDVREGTELKDIKVNDKFALIMGNEGKGVSSDIAFLSNKKLNISMSKSVESLNVSVATSIILYELYRRK